MLHSKDVDYNMFPSFKTNMLKLVADAEAIYLSETSAEEKNAQLAALLNNA